MQDHLLSIEKHETAAFDFFTKITGVNINETQDIRQMKGDEFSDDLEDIIRGGVSSDMLQDLINIHCLPELKKQSKPHLGNHICNKVCPTPKILYGTLSGQFHTSPKQLDPTNEIEGSVKSTLLESLLRAIKNIHIPKKDISNSINYKALFEGIESNIKHFMSYSEYELLSKSEDINKIFDHIYYATLHMSKRKEFKSPEFIDFRCILHINRMIFKFLKRKYDRDKWDIELYRIADNDLEKSLKLWQIEMADENYKWNQLRSKRFL